MRKILVLRGGALGDFLVTLPAIALLRQRWPASRIELIGNATAARLALCPSIAGCGAKTKCHPLDDTGSDPLRGDFGKCHSIDDTGSKAMTGAASGGKALLDAVHSQHEGRWAALYGSEPLLRPLAEWLGEFDLVLNFWPDPSGELRAKFPLRQAQVFLSAEATPARTPAAAHFCAPLREVGLETDTLIHRFEALGTIPRGGKIAIHPGSGSPRKNWPLERWEELCTRLRGEGHGNLLIVTGEVENVAAEKLRRFGELADNLPLSELAARLAECRLFLGHDSGISHLAAACGTPGILLFGPTDPVMWAPPAVNIQTIKRGATLESISVSEVMTVVRAALAAAR